MLDLSSPVLDALDEADRRALLSRSVVRLLPAGGILYLAGNDERRVHVVVEGVVKHSARDADGRETILGLSLPGDLLGEAAALDEGAHALDAVAATAARVVGLDADTFRAAVSRSAKASFELAQVLATRYRWVCNSALERSSAEVPARLAGRLLDLAELMGRMRQGVIELDLPLDQKDLGGLAGMCRESACKTLRRLKGEGVVDYRGRRLRILRPDALERLRCGGSTTEPGGDRSAAAT